MGPAHRHKQKQRLLLNQDVLPWVNGHTSYNWYSHTVENYAALKKIYKEMNYQGIKRHKKP